MPTENVMKTTATEPVVGATTGSTAQPAIGSPIRASGELESDSKRLNSTTEEAADACQGFDWVTVRKTEPISQPSPDFNQRTAHQLSAENGAEALKDISLTKMDSAEDLEQEFALRFERSKGQTSSCDGNEWQSPSASSPEVGKKLFRNHKNEALSTVEILRCLRAFELTFGKYPHCAPEDVEFTTAESEHMVATILSLEYYQKCMEEICALNSHYVAPESLEELHCIVRKSALGIFESIPKTKNADVSAIMLQKLRVEIDKNFSRFHVHNETKRMLQTLRTPLFLSSSVATIFSVSRGVTSLGLGLLADFFFLVGGLLLLAVLIWIYTRVTGDLQELGDSIDNSVNRAWEEISWQVEKLMIRCCVSLGPILKTAWKEDSLPDPAVPDLRSKPEKSESF